MKKGFTLLELVLAIVIIAIAVSALPKIISQTQKSNEFALKQELIFHAKSMMVNVFKYPWDSNAYEEDCRNKGGKKDCGNTNNIRLPIYNIPSFGEAEDNRPGIIDTTALGNYPHRKPTSRYTPTADRNFTAVSYGEYGLNGKKLNDLDDFDGYIINNIRSVVDDGDFVTNADLNLDVAYVSDTLLEGNYRDSRNIAVEFSQIPSANPTNIKMVKINAIDRNTDLNVTMYGYSFNIGDNPGIPYITR